MTNSTAFETWWSEYQRSSVLSPVALGMTRDDIRSIFGEPDAVARGLRRRPQTGIWRFGAIEFHFGTDGRLYLVYTEDEHGTPRVIAKNDAA